MCCLFRARHRCNENSFGVIFMHVTHEKKVFFFRFAERKLGCICVMMPQMWTKKKNTRGKGNKNNNKNAFSLPRSQIAECRPHHHNRIAAKKKTSDCMCLCIAERWNVHIGSWLRKLKIFFFAIFKSNWKFTNAKKFLSVSGTQQQFRFYHLTVEANFFTIEKKIEGELSPKCINFLQKLTLNAFFCGAVIDLIRRVIVKVKTLKNNKKSFVDSTSLTKSGF